MDVNQLNPERAGRIMAHTGWTRLEPGTLNLEVPQEVLTALENIEPVWVEDGASVIYPPPFTHIPARRVAYHYYVGNSGYLLVRKAKVAIPERVEILAPVNLRKKFNLRDGDIFGIEIRSYNGSQPTR